MAGRNYIQSKRTWPVAAILSIGALAALQVACSSSSGGSSATATAVTGTLTQTSASASTDAVGKFENSFATTGTSVQIDCGTAGTFTATVDSKTGAFAATGVPAGVPCSFTFVNTSTGATKCQVALQDSSNYDLNHNTASANSSSLSSGSLAMGSMTCDTSGNISMASSSLSGLASGANLASSTAFDFTGVWTAAAYTGTLPTGYKTLTTCSGNNSCSGPPVGQVITLVRFHGVQFTPNSGSCTPAINVSCPASAGTDTASKEGYAMSIWGGDYAHGIGACGGMTGFTADEARAYAQLDLDTTPPTVAGNTLTYGHYVWSTPSGFGGDTGWTQPWMFTGAKSQYAVSDCQPVLVPSTVSGTAAKVGMACFSQEQTFSGVGNGTYVWSVGLQNSGGCVDSSGAPLMVNNWSNITNGTCTNTASAFNTNMNTSSCTYTAAPTLGAASQTFTCSNTFGVFNDISGLTGASNNNGPNFSAPATLPANTWPGQPATVLAAGAACKGSSSETALKTLAGGTASAAQAAAAKELLYRYQCYANAFWQNSSNGSASTACVRDYNFNWQTNNYANFITGDDRSMKPQNAFITDRVFYSTDGTWAFLKNTDVKFQSIPTSTGSVQCPMNVVTTLKFQKQSSNSLLVNFNQTTQMADTSASCQGAVSAALAGGGTLTNDPTGLNNLYNQLQPQKLIWVMTK